MKTDPLLLAFVLFIAALLAGCAGTSADTDFRRKVESVTVAGQAEYDPVSQATSGSAAATVHFRNPDAKTVKPLSLLPPSWQVPLFSATGERIEPRVILCQP